MKIALFFILFLVALLLGLLLYIIFNSRQQKLKNNEENLIGLIAIAETDLDLQGIILVSGEVWKAIARVKILKGSKVKVIGTQGVLLEVEPILPKVFAKKT